MKENDYISREEVISHLEYCLANFTDYKKALEETLDKVKHTRAISLPKGHGRLIDADALIKAIEEKAKRLSNANTINGLCGAVALIFDAPTIIESDKGCDTDE